MRDSMQNCFRTRFEHEHDRCGSGPAIPLTRTRHALLPADSLLMPIIRASSQTRPAEPAASLSPALTPADAVNVSPPDAHVLLLCTRLPLTPHETQAGGLE